MRKRKRVVEYADKYNHKSSVLRIVYDHIYKRELVDFGIKSNMVAVSGESINTYINEYIPRVIGNIGKAIIMEVYYPRLRRLKTRLKNSTSKLKNKIKIVGGNIIGYEMNPIVNKFIKTPARFLDLGLGIGINDLCQMARLMLHSQQKICKNRKKKVIVLDAARRGVSDANCVKYLNSFLESIDQRIVSINGQKITKITKFSKVFTKGTAFNKDLSRKGQPMLHKIVLSGNKQRKAVLNLYTYMNGSAMLTAVLKYK